MASKLNIDKDKVDSIPGTGTSTPRSAEAGGAGGEASAGPFRGAGQSLSGKKPKTKKADKPIEQPDEFSMIRRTE
jgi:ubiquitin fusion degradation protein 1